MTEHVVMKSEPITERALREALKGTPSVSAAAVQLGISRPKVYRLMTKYGIEKRRIFE